VRKIYKHTGAMLLFLLASTANARKVRTGAAKFQKKSGIVVKLINTLAAQVKQGISPTAKQIGEIKKLYPYIPKHYYKKITVIMVKKLPVILAQDLSDKIEMKNFIGPVVPDKTDVNDWVNIIHLNFKKLKDDFGTTTEDLKKIRGILEQYIPKAKNFPDKIIPKLRWIFEHDISDPKELKNIVPEIAKDLKEIPKPVRDKIKLKLLKIGIIKEPKIKKKEEFQKIIKKHAPTITGPELDTLSRSLPFVIGANIPTKEAFSKEIYEKIKPAINKIKTDLIKGDIVEISEPTPTPKKDLPKPIIKKPVKKFTFEPGYDKRHLTVELVEQWIQAEKDGKKEGEEIQKLRQYVRSKIPKATKNDADLNHEVIKAIKSYITATTQSARIIDVIIKMKRTL